MKAARGRSTLILALVLVIGACTGDSGSSTTAESLPEDTVVATTAATTTVPELASLEPNGSPVLSLGDRGEYVAALQWLLVCNGYEQLTEDGPVVVVDGAYGPITAAAVSYVQAQMHRIPTGAPDEAVVADLSRRCTADRIIEMPAGSDQIRVAGWVAPDDDEVLVVTGRSGWTLNAETLEGPVQFAVRDADGATIKEARESAPWSVELANDRVLRIRVVASESTPFLMRISMDPPPQVTIDFGSMVLGPTGLEVVEFGAEPTSVLDVLGSILGDPDTDTGWESSEECEGFNRHLTYIVQRAEDGTAHPAVLSIHLSDVGFPDPSFAEYAYESLDLESLDTGARSLATAEGLSLGSTATEVSAAYNRPTPFEEGPIEFTDGMRFAARTPGEEADGDTEAALVVSLIGAGRDGCPDE